MSTQMSGEAADQRCECGLAREGDCPDCGSVWMAHRSHAPKGKDWRSKACPHSTHHYVPAKPAIVEPVVCETCEETERYPGTDLLRHQHVRPFGEGSGDHEFKPVVNPIAEDEAALDALWLEYQRGVEDERLNGFTYKRDRARFAIERAIERRAAAVSAAKVEVLEAERLSTERDEALARMTRAQLEAVGARTRRDEAIASRDALLTAAKALFVSGAWFNDKGWPEWDALRALVPSELAPSETSKEHTNDHESS